MGTMSKYTEMAQYHAHNPDPRVAGCLNTLRDEQGVVFPGIEPDTSAFCFVGESSILAACHVIWGADVRKLRDYLEGKEDDKTAAYEARIAELEKELKKYENFIDAAEDAGIFIPAIS